MTYLEHELLTDIYAIIHGMSVTQAKDVRVYFVKAKQGIRSAKEAFDELESHLSSLKGRKFYGLIYGKPPEDEYYACVAVEPEDELKPLPLEKMTVPGGLYAQERIMDWAKNIPKFKEVFGRLRNQYEMDSSKPCVEFYRSMQEVLCRVPIVKE